MASSKTSLSAGFILRQLLLENDRVKAITRQIFPVIRDEAQLPYVFYCRTGMEAPQVKGRGAADTVEMELQCCAADYEQSLELAEAVRAALDGMQAEDEASGLTMRSCFMTDSSETWADDAYIQILIFNVKI